MPKEFKILSGARESEQNRKPVTPEVKLMHFRNVAASLNRDALNTWGEIWSELQDVADAQAPFAPACGWPEFLEKVWLMGRYLEHAQRFYEGKE